MSYTTEQFIEKAICKHGWKYNYKDVDYKDSKIKVNIWCNKCNGYFLQVPNNHLLGYNCPKCRGIFKQKYYSNNIPLFNTYARQLVYGGHICKRSIADSNIIEISCVYCGKWYTPKVKAVKQRIVAIKGIKEGNRDNNFYCSDNCKKACPTFGQKKYPKGFKPATSREVQPQLRKLVLKRDDYKCQICDDKESELHCHHITAVTHNPIESADVDNCITLCKKHHKQVHKLPDCVYHELKCIK